MHYTAVGIMEDLNSTYSLFEKKIPYFFKNIMQKYQKLMRQETYKSGTFTTKNKKSIFEIN